MATNNFGDNWLSDNERAYWGVDEYGNPVREKTDEEIDRELSRIRTWNKLHMDVLFWPLFLGGPWLLLFLLVALPKIWVWLTWSGVTSR
jgi:hypothetical protein